jgi:hypothetical protein
MTSFPTAKAAAALALCALLFGAPQASAQPPGATTASGSHVNATFKIFNYSKYEVRLKGVPVRFGGSQWEVKKGPPAAKGQMTLLLKDERFYMPGFSGAATDARLILDLLKDGRDVTCYVAVAYGKKTQLGFGMDLGVSQPTVQGCEGIKVDWQISQNDLEIYVDLPQASWAMR